MLRKVAPAGVPYGIAEFLAAVRAACGSSELVGSLENDFRKHAGARHCHVVGSGRAAFTLILKALIETARSDRNVIVIPAYTCFTVPASIARAGLKIKLADIDPNRMDYDYEKLAKLDFSDALAIIPCNLFGIVSDWNRLAAIAQKNEIAIIDDSAQTFGITYQGKQSGSFGIAGFYSLGRGKNITAVGGGVILTDDDDLATAIGTTLRQIGTPGVGQEIKSAMKILAYSVFLHPWFYWIPESIPFLGLGKTIYDEDFPISRLTRIQAAMASQMLQQYEELNKNRLENSEQILNALAGDKATSEYLITGLDYSIKRPFLRLPLLAPSSDIRRKVVAILNRAGIGASTMYPSTICDIPGIDRILVNGQTECPGAKLAAERLFTLPTHPYLAKKDIKKIVNVLKKAIEAD